MDLPEIGLHCSLQSCNALDLLPIKCQCEKFFCRDHISPSQHECPAGTDKQATDSEIARSLEKRERCSISSCDKPGLGNCPRCDLLHCVDHRHFEAHACAPPAPESLPTERNARGKALLKEALAQKPSSSTSVSRATFKTTDPKKLAQLKKVEAMKMRHRAVPGDPKDNASSVPVSERLHIKVKGLDSDSKESIVWLRKSIGTGKAIDVLAAFLSISRSDSHRLEFRDVSTDDAGIPLRNDQPLASQVDEGSSLHITLCS